MPPEDKEHQHKLGSIRTMKTDADELVSKQKTSFLEMFEKQHQMQYQKGYKNPTSRGVGRKRLFRAILILIILGGIILGGAFGFYIFQRERQVQIETEMRDPTPHRAFLTNSDQEIIRIRENDRTGLLSETDQKRTTPTPLGRYLYAPIIIDDFDINPRLATHEEFFETLRISPPQDFFENIGPRWNLLFSDQHTILVFEVTNFQGMLAVMARQWEGTITEDIARLLPNGIRVGDREPFISDIVENNEVRIQRFSSTDDTAVTYALLFGELLIITTSEETITRIIEQLVELPTFR